VLLAIAFVVIAGTVLALPMLLPAGDDGGVADASATRRPRRTAVPSEPAVVAPEATPSVAPAPTLSPTSRPSTPVVASPSATPASTPDRTRRPRPEPTPEPTPQPTRRPRPDPTPEPTPPPPEPTPEPTPPPIQTVRARIPDRWFAGDYNGEGSGRYHGRSASWVYGQGTQYHTMTARFRLEHEGQTVRRASLQVVGLDGEDPPKHSIRIVLNGATIYEGANPLPNDACCGPSGPGNWGSAVFRFAGDLVRRNNSLVVTNLEPGECTTCPNYVMVDYAVLEYRVQP
jgi:hypothetical protein